MKCWGFSGEQKRQMPFPVRLTLGGGETLTVNEISKCGNCRWGSCFEEKEASQ